MVNSVSNPLYNQKLFGHEKIEELLSQYYSSGKMHHAFLFEGEEGIGKATLGFRYAGHIFQNPDFRQAPSKMYALDPNLPIVRQMDSRALHDFLYLSYPFDSKKGTLRTVITVDEIRRIRHFLSLTADKGHWRIVMIDPADGMNHNAANALLKSLEEPPEKVLFILISHVSGKILSTIRSRCISVKFKALSENNLYKALESLNISIAQESSHFLKIASRGSVLRAIKILNYGCDKVIAAYIKLMRAQEKQSIRYIMQEIADELSHKESSVAFHFLTEFVVEEIFKSAKEAALSGNIEGADKIIQMGYAIKKRVDSFFIYHLDRRQTIFYLLEKAKDCCQVYYRDFACA
ncbi:MAG: DNA polymerase III subunit delta' [Candidatus Liberibacter ctenarytainae]|uniref:DNA polymerase III subunit delta n=1 Tax=Candidatus Liberibacter ctenarytainae TaxID=2020335 RepID=A0A937ACE6_9HYPH|nr:DNA polymerase III subunit delta' [Candidatus Liberibacter ctenarytainae]